MQVLSKTKSATTIKISGNLVVKTYSNTVPLEISKNFILKYIAVSKHIDCLPEVVKYNEKTITTKYETHIPFWRYVLSSPNNLNKLVKKFIDIQFLINSTQIVDSSLVGGQAYLKDMILSTKIISEQSKMLLIKNCFNKNEKFLVHGDYTFNNVLIKKDGSLKIIDWDTSLIFHPLFDFFNTYYIYSKDRRMSVLKPLESIFHIFLAKKIKKEFFKRVEYSKEEKLYYSLLSLVFRFEVEKKESIKVNQNLLKRIRKEEESIFLLTI
ncbi:MAG: phosphotransferase [Flavobacteriales bacterium]|nr:phosphotransferase [Flavobacteriales bacterium]